MNGKRKMSDKPVQRQKERNAAKVRNVESSAAQQKEGQRVQNAGIVIKEIPNVPDDIPQQLLDKAECVIILPSVVKFAIGLGVDCGRGVMTCRGGKDCFRPVECSYNDRTGRRQLGVSVGRRGYGLRPPGNEPRCADSILSSEVKLGTGISAAAGPKGRDASAATDVDLRTEVLSYSRSRGLIAGMYLEGSTLRPNKRCQQESL